MRRATKSLELCMHFFKSQRAQCTYIVFYIGTLHSIECRVSILGIVIMIWESVFYNST